MSTGPTPPIGGTPIVTPQTVIEFLRIIQDAFNQAVNKIVDEIDKLLPSPPPPPPPPPPPDKTQPSVGGSVPPSAQTIAPGAP